MQHFFVTELNWQDDKQGVAYIIGEQAHHLSRVLRANVGDSLTIAYSDEVYRAQISQITVDKVDLLVFRTALPNPELPVDILLIQGLPKADKLEHIIMKACELGVAEIQPCACERSVSHDKKEKLLKIGQRRNEIALAACKQSHRARLVQVKATVSLQEALATSQADYILFAYELSKLDDNLASWFKKHSDELKKTLAPSTSSAKRIRLAIVVGPEGGFSSQEASLISHLPNCSVINLGARILRTETAPLTMLSYLMLEFEQIANDLSKL